VTICPCCGFKSSHSAGAISSEACLSCGAHSVGEALPRPEHELPSYGRSLLLVVTGVLSVLVFVADTIITLITHKPFSFGFWSWIAAAETAAWHLKWAMIPLTILVAFGSRRIYRSILQAPDNFCGLRYARNGYFASAAVPLLVLILIGVTVPARLRHRQWGIEAAEQAQAYASGRVLQQFLNTFGKYPLDKKDLAQLPDPDGSIAALLKEIDASEYKPTAEVAVVPNQNPRPLRGAVIRNASLSTAPDEPLSEGLTFTNYELRLPGVDKIINTEDDLLVRDGVVHKASDTPHRGVIGTSAAQPRNP
jgi:hypothetical protein